MIWCKNDKDIQNCLLKLETANKLVQTADRSTAFSKPQMKAIDVMGTIDESNKSMEELRDKSYIFNKLYQSIRATIYASPISNTDIININADVSVLLQVFGSKATVGKALALVA